MKICYLGNINLPWNRDLADYFADKGHRIYFITFEGPKIKYKNTEIIRLKTGLGFFKYLLYLPKIKKIIQAINPDLIHVNWATSYGFISSLLDFHPLVISCIGGDVLLEEQKADRNPMRILLIKLIIRNVLKKADYLLPISKEVERKIISYGLPTDKMQVFFVEPVIKNMVSQKEETTIISNRRLTELYQIDVFLKACALVKKQLPNIKIVIAGEGNKKQQYLKLAHQLGLKGNIEFTGWLPEEKMQERISQAAIFVSTSPSDGTPASILEAMELKTAVVAVDNQASQEWIKHNSSGYLFACGDYKRAADYILDLLKNKDKRRLFSERSYKIVKEKADFSKNIIKLEKVYSSLVKNETQGREP